MSHELPEDSHLVHYGTKTFSGRYPWGSGEDPYQRLQGFLSETRRLKKEGYSEAQIAEVFGLDNSTHLRDVITIAGYDKKKYTHERVHKLREKGWGHTAIGKELGIGESQVRNILKPTYLARQQRFESAVDALRHQVDEKGMVDVSAGIQSAMNIKETEKNKVIRALQMEGYEKHIVKERQALGHDTTVMVLAKPGTKWSDVQRNTKDIKTFSGDLDRIIETGNLSGTVKPLSIDGNRVKIRYKDEGGGEEDGLIYIRPGVKDLSMGNASYSQVRVLVNDSHYIKGMAVYKEDLPKGVDIVVNTPKGRDVPVYGDKKKSILKPIEDDPNNPFGSSISKQITEGKGKNERAVSALNIINDEADWDDWSRNLPAQFLSKQSDKLARTQLELTRSRKRSELDEINALTNPTVKRHMLLKYADSADASAIHLKAAALARQKTHVLLPVPSLKDNEVYAPNYKDGERVALVRFPHAGTFEIPELVVNNSNKDAKSLFSGTTPKAAIGINANVAERLSGADFDGDTVLVIPNNSGHIKTRSPLKGLENFDPKATYAEVPGMKLMSKKNTGMEMGRITNLITDMQLRGANEDEVTRAVKHSMVVIDAHKHRLNYKLSEVDNGIPDLRKKYQDGGASTIISRAKSPEHIPERKARLAGDGGPFNPDGSKAYVPTDRGWVDRTTGEKKYYMQKVPKMGLVKDAHELSSGTPKEVLYADHANALKSLGNEARRSYMATPKMQKNTEASAKYKTEVEELREALRKAKANAPRERLAQRAANARVQAYIEENPGVDRSDLKKYHTRSLVTARDRIGAKKDRIVPTPKQWEAIQAGAISNHMLEEILRNGDQEAIVSLATPKKNKTLSSSKIAMIKSLSARGYTQADIAEHLGISTSTVNEYA